MRQKSGILERRSREARHFNPYFLCKMDAELLCNLWEVLH